MRTRVRVAALLAVSAVALTACSSGSSEDSSPASPAETASAAAEASAMPVAPEGSTEDPAAEESPAASEQSAEQAAKDTMVLAQQLMSFASEVSQSARSVPQGQSDMQLFEFLAKEPASWAAGAERLVGEADAREAQVTVEGVPLEKATAASFKLEDGIVVAVKSSAGTCTVKAVFVPGDLVTMAWEGPDCGDAAGSPADPSSP